MPATDITRHSRAGFEISGPRQSWRHRWDEVELRGENENLFIFAVGEVLFIFGKQFLSVGQQHELRMLSDLA